MFISHLNKTPNRWNPSIPKRYQHKINAKYHYTQIIKIITMDTIQLIIRTNMIKKII